MEYGAWVAVRRENDEDFAIEAGGAIIASLPTRSAFPV